jgi:hypothetical protein
MRIIILHGFKLCKYFEVIQLFEAEPNRHNDAGTLIYESFLKNFGKLFKFPLSTNQHAQLSLHHADKYENLLDLNFYFAKQCTLSKISAKDIDHVTASLANSEQIAIGKFFTLTQQLQTDFNINMSSEIDSNLTDCLNPVLKVYSNIFITNLIEKYHLFLHFELLNSFFLFKSNEVMFLFSKTLTDMVKVYDTFQDDLILNKLFYRCIQAQSSYTAIDNKLNIQQLFYFKYSKDSTTNTFISTKDASLLNRLITGISLKFILKWPFNFVLQNDDLDVYNRFFNAILQIKQVKYNLDGLEFKGSSVF